MSRTVPPEINTRHPTILFVGRDPGSEETQSRRPFVGAAGRTLDALLHEAGLRRSECNITNLVPKQPHGNDFSRHTYEEVLDGVTDLYNLIDELRPTLVVTFGNEASWALVPDWPTTDDTPFTAKGVRDLRGFIWTNEELDVPVLTTLHPASVLPYRDPSGIGRVLLLNDLLKAARWPFPAPRRDVKIVRTKQDVREARRVLRSGMILGADIETPDGSARDSLACIGFAPSPSTAYVYTEPVFEDAFDILRDPKIQKIFHNGIFDTYYLSTRWDVEVAAYSDDTSVAWHACWPEISGAEGRSEKSLRFLASLYTDEPFWKDYEFENLDQMYRLNGIDCCVTYEAWEKLMKEIDELGVEDTYRLEMGLVPVFRKIQERGIRVDVGLLDERIESISSRAEGIVDRIQELAKPILKDRIDRLENPHLIFGSRTCTCCGGGSSKSSRCWSCAGFESSPSKKELVAAFPDEDPKLLKDELEARVLGPCVVCGGVGKFETFDFNPNSSTQRIDLLYNVMKLPRRRNNNKLTADEAALKSLLGALTE